MRSSGFTLIELAVVLAIVGLLMGGLLLPLATQVEMRRVQDTQKTLEDIRQALVGYAIADPRNRFPCPDTDGDGLENAPCVNVEGVVPWATLGVRSFDAWGRQIRYLADNNYTGAAGVPNPPDTACCLYVRDRRDPVPPPDPAVLTDPNPAGTNGPAAIIFSCVKNGVPDPGAGGFGVNPGNDNDGILNIDSNCTNAGVSDGVYIQDVFTEGAFDDLLVWVSKNTLINQLVTAGVWP